MPPISGPYGRSRLRRTCGRSLAGRRVRRRAPPRLSQRLRRFQGVAGWPLAVCELLRPDSAPPCPSLPEPPCSRVQVQQRRSAATRRNAGPPCPLRGHPPFMALHAAEATAVPGHRRRFAHRTGLRFALARKKGLCFHPRSRKRFFGSHAIPGDQGKESR